MNRMRVLVFPGGTEIALEIWSALRDCKDVQLLSAGQDIPNHAPFVFPEYHLLPAVSEKGWLEELNSLVERLGIDYIYPAHDEAVFALASHASEVRARVVTSPVETCLITRFKSKTYAALAGAAPVPRIFSCPAQVDTFPVFCKPDRGQGSHGARRIDSRERLTADLPEGDLILEYLPGPEYTVDCFSDRDRGLMFAGGRERLRVRNGISVSTRPVEDPVFEALAKAISSRLALHGAWFFQLKQDRDGNMKVLEVAPRIAGAMALHRVCGINFPLLSLYEQQRLPLRILRQNVRVCLDRALVNRYTHDLVFRTVYVDLDDTLIIRGMTNTRLLAFLYQCLNRGIRLVLVTRHSRDVQETLDRHRLGYLFDEIVHLPDGQSKAAAIRERNAIFIDDSFSERLQVHEAAGIPTFDCSMVEMLFDDREMP
jgi:carbamoyl-phosphate synthase large subunit